MVAAELRNRNAADILLFKMKEAGEIAHPKRGVYCLPEYAGKIGKKERLDDEAAENKAENVNLSNLSDLSGGISQSPTGKIGNGQAIPDIDAAADELLGRGEPPGRMVANGFAISATPEDRHEPGPGHLACRVWIRETRPPALGPPGDSLDDFIA